MGLFTRDVNRWQGAIDREKAQLKEYKKKAARNPGEGWENAVADLEESIQHSTRKRDEAQKEADSRQAQYDREQAPLLEQARKAGW